MERTFAGDRGLANAAGTGKQKGVMQPIVVERVHQRPDNMLLTHELGKRAGAPLARKNLVAQGRRFAI